CSSGVVTEYNGVYPYTKKSRHINVYRHEIQREIGKLRPERDSSNATTPMFMRVWCSAGVVD
ncbi:hypothetical protein, partial [Mammaliicoccus lentus]|uniref:hypothetical protein n=1 Tax=Mammaliicoccus lentus TaxID=42858 RepID=UPI001D15F18B